MTTTLLSEQLRQAVQNMVHHSGRRAVAETQTRAEYQAHTDKVTVEFRETEQRLQDELSSRQDQAIRVFQESMQALTTRFESENEAVSREYSARRLKANTLFDTAREEMQSQLEENQWTIETIFEADKRVAKEELVKIQRLVGTSIQRIDTKYKEIVDLGERWELDELMETVQATPRAEQYPDAVAALQECVSVEESTLAQFQTFKTPHLLKGYRLVFLFAGLWLLLQIPALWMAEWYYWMGASLIAISSIGAMVYYLLTHSLRVNFVRLFQPSNQAKVDAAPLQKRCLEEATAHYHEQLSLAKTKHEQALDQAKTKHEQALAERTQQRDLDLEALTGKYEPALEKLKRKRDVTFKKIEGQYQQEMAASTQDFDIEMEQATRRRDQLLEEGQQAFQSAWAALTQEWEQAISSFRRVTHAVQQQGDHLFPSWEQLQQSMPVPAAVPPGMRLGTLQISLDVIPDGIPEDEALRSLTPEPVKLPALLSFPERGSLLLKSSDEGRAAAVQLLQAVMLRCLTAIPPGKVRFTIFDPVGLGENFAAFAHLADYDEKLVSSRIWTEASHIEQRLADLTEHIENVIQKYLRNQFNTLEEYNEQAGEIAEPYRILVVAHFPVNFTEEAARRLLSIAASGARCGIHTFILVDTKQPLPRNFELNDLEQNSSILVWQDGAFHWQDPDFSRFPLQLDTPPPAEVCTLLVQVVGERARLASRVEVPFQQVAPPPEEWWTGDSRRGLRVALGKAGATRKQYLELGEGTSQHVLIAGKTGSGKSTLLHALIVQLALTYSPDEVELYLVDFKKGVEFKTYATHELPHARVVAIESEREFGLSVLQRLDQELKVRGDRFRSLGVNDLPSFRATSLESLPRVLLIVDEFQEFFVEDDRVAQESALLLDRLVRQGRAFGIHVLLGSQTLGGAYSLARSTIDQMAVRIALQCSEADGHLILSKENSAARLLSRPGEAIYNNANGLLEGNNLFQTVWLSEQKREECLRQLAQRAAAEQTAPRPMIVFEGNAPAVLSKNPFLPQLLYPTAVPANGIEYPAWLGDSIAIKEPTAAVFRRQSGCNLLLVGQHPEASLSILSAAVISLGLGLARQKPLIPDPSPPQPGRGKKQFYLLCHSVGDNPSEEVYHQLAEVFPRQMEVVGWKDCPTILSQLAEEVDQRLAQRTEIKPPLFLVIHGLQHFRELRRQDDDFGFSRRDENKPVPPSRQFNTILREGPLVGVFTLVWCDTLNNLQRTFDRQTLREFEMRVLFQMNANDSSNLIDSPAASRLGLYRALFYTEDQGRTEKFRPYGLPPQEWLTWLKEQATGLNRTAPLERGCYLS